MEAEAQPSVDKLGLKRDESLGLAPHCPAVGFSGTVVAESGASLEVVLVCNGKCKEFGVDNVGTVPAALTAFAAINAVKPDLVINAGTCGGFKAVGGAIGDVYVSTSVANHDRRIQLPGFTEYGVGKYGCHPAPAVKSAVGGKDGVVSTGNSLDWNEDDMRLMKANGATCKEMEAAAIGWACSLSGTPFFCLKAVTDIVDGDRPTHEEFLENLGRAAQALQGAMVAAVGAIAGRPLSAI